MRDYDRLLKSLNNTMVFNGRKVVYGRPSNTPYESMSDLSSDKSKDLTESLNAMFALARRNL